MFLASEGDAAFSAVILSSKLTAKPVLRLKYLTQKWISLKHTDQDIKQSKGALPLTWKEDPTD